jgi:hypothetical protein
MTPGFWSGHPEESSVCKPEDVLGVAHVKTEMQLDIGVRIPVRNGWCPQ